jgi:hypothetical protein
MGSSNLKPKKTDAAASKDRRLKPALRFLMQKDRYLGWRIYERLKADEWVTEKSLSRWLDLFRLGWPVRDRTSAAEAQGLQLYRRSKDLLHPPGYSNPEKI